MDGMCSEVAGRTAEPAVLFFTGFEFASEAAGPELLLLGGAVGASGSVGVESGGDDPGFAEAVIENDEAGIKGNVTIGQLEVVWGMARQFGFHEILEVVAPVTEAAAEWERKVHLIKQFVPGHEAVEQTPGIAELD